jgi:hypothetical protein
MIIERPKHYFEAKCPVLEEHEEDYWFRHPVYPLKCNTLGIIVIDEDIDWVFTDKHGYKIRKSMKHGSSVAYTSIGHSIRLAYECYTGLVTKHKKFILLDNNPYNLTFENIFAYVGNTKESKQIFRQRREFIELTLQYMFSKKPMLDKKGISLSKYWDVAVLPQWLLKEFYKTDYIEPDKPIVYRDPKAKYVPKRKNRTKAEIAELKAEIQELKRGGMTNKDIMDKYGIRSGAMLQYYTKTDF